MLVLGVVYAAVMMGESIIIGFKLPLAEYGVVIMAVVASAYSFVWTGAKIAPSHHYKVSILMTVIYGIMSGSVIAWKIFGGNNTSISWFEAIATTIGIISAIIACNKF